MAGVIGAKVAARPTTSPRLIIATTTNFLMNFPSEPNTEY
jgi:hypothetical protein